MNSLWTWYCNRVVDHIKPHPLPSRWWKHVILQYCWAQIGPAHVISLKRRFLSTCHAAARDYATICLWRYWSPAEKLAHRAHHHSNVWPFGGTKNPQSWRRFTKSKLQRTWQTIKTLLGHRQTNKWRYEARMNHLNFGLIFEVFPKQAKSWFGTNPKR